AAFQVSSQVRSPDIRGLPRLVSENRAGLFRHPAVVAREVQERFTTLVFPSDDLAHENLVVSAGKDVDDTAIDKSKAIGQNRCGRGGRPEFQVREILRSGFRKAA